MLSDHARTWASSSANPGARAERRRAGDRRGRQSHAVRRVSGISGTPGERMAAGPRISPLFLLGSPSGREDSERKLGERWGQRDFEREGPDSPAASRPKGESGMGVGGRGVGLPASFRHPSTPSATPAPQRVCVLPNPLQRAGARRSSPRLARTSLGAESTPPDPTARRLLRGPAATPAPASNSPWGWPCLLPGNRPRTPLPRDPAAWPLPPGSGPRRVPELQPETRSWAPAAAR